MGLLRRVSDPIKSLVGQCNAVNSLTFLKRNLNTVMMQMMQTMMAAQMQPASKKAKKKDDGMDISTSATYLWQLPILRLQDAIEFVYKEFDPVKTDKWEMPDLMRLLWAIVQCPPNLQVLYIYIYTYTYGVRCGPGNGIGLSESCIRSEGGIGLLRLYAVPVTC